MIEKPKRPLSAYLIWLNQSRDQLKRDNPGLKITEIAKLGGLMWNDMEDKSVWIRKAARAKAKYQRALKEYKAKKDAAAGGRGKKMMKKKQPPAKRTTKRLSGNLITQKPKKNKTVFSVKRTFF